MFLLCRLLQLYRINFELYNTFKCLNMVSFLLCKWKCADVRGCFSIYFFPPVWNQFTNLRLKMFPTYAIHLTRRHRDEQNNRIRTQTGKPANIFTYFLGFFFLYNWSFVIKKQTRCETTKCNGVFLCFIGIRPDVNHPFPTYKCYKCGHFFI